MLARWPCCREGNPSDSIQVGLANLNHADCPASPPVWNSAHGGLFETGYAVRNPQPFPIADILSVIMYEMPFGFDLMAGRGHTIFSTFLS